MYGPNTSSCGYTDRIISMMMGVAFSRGAVSMRITPSIGSVLPVWREMSSSAGSDMGMVLLWDRMRVRARRSGDGVREKRCERGNLVGGAFDADHRRAVDTQRQGHGGGQLVDVGDVHRHQTGEHRRQAGPQLAGPEPVVAVEVVVEQVLAGHAHRVGVVV